jgi:peptidyl-prolyl cis-trans isomerase C
MKKYLLILFALSLLASLFCCSKEDEKRAKILSRINNYSLTIDEFEGQLAAELEFDKNFKLTRQAKKEFLDELIFKELFIQEAKKMKLDRKDKFVRSIERYWESSLIRDLIDLKSEEIDKKVSVTQEEITDYYNEKKQNDQATPPLARIKDKVRHELKEKKKSRMLKEWTDGLRENAEIEIDQNLL